MKNKEEIVDILMEELDYVYCWNCRASEIGDDSNCDDCHRKYMMWEISKKYAEGIANKILE